MALGLAASATGLAQPVFSWTDADGVEHYTNDPASIPKKVRARPVTLDDAADLVIRYDDAADAPDAGPSPSAPAAAAAPSLERKRRILARLDRKAWRAAPEDEYDAANTPVFLQLAASPDPVLATAGLLAAASECSPNPGAGATHDGKPYARVPCSDEFHRVALSRLPDPVWRVRSAAASAASHGAWGPSPREETLAALGDRLGKEDRADVANLVRSALWSCHCARPQLVDAALSGLARADPASRYVGLSLLGLVGRKGRVFDAEALRRMNRAAEPFLADTSPAFRERAVRAWAVTTDQATAMPRLLALTKDREPAVRAAALALLAEYDDPAIMPVLVTALGDGEAIELRPEEGVGGSTGTTVSQAALWGLAVLSGSRLGGEGFRPTRFPTRPTPEELAGEIARARRWYAEHKGAFPAK